MRSDDLKISQFFLFSLFLHAMVAAALTINFSIQATPKTKPIEITLQPPPPAPRPPQPLLPPPPPQTAQLVENETKQQPVDSSTSQKLSNANRQVAKETQKISRNPSQSPKEILDDKNEPSEVIVRKKNPGTEKLKNIEEGLETLLNTREFKFYNYLTKIKKHVGLFWESQVREGLATDPSAEASLSAGLATKLMVRIDLNGNITDAIILKSCGIDRLDEAVLQAFKMASPFQVPPKDLVDPEGGLSVTWDFLID